VAVQGKSIQKENLHLLDDEVKLGSNQHDQAKQRGDGSMNYRGQPLLQTQLHAHIALSQTRHETLQ